jgi:hypothetical protein
MAALTVTSVTIDGTQLTYNFDDNSQLVMDKGTTPNDYVVQQENLLNTDLLKKLLIQRHYALNPGLNDPSSINGVTLEINLASVLNPMSFGQE